LQPQPGCRESKSKNTNPAELHHLRAKEKRKGFFGRNPAKIEKGTMIREERAKGKRKKKRKYALKRLKTSR